MWVHCEYVCTHVSSNLLYCLKIIVILTLNWIKKWVMEVAEQLLLYSSAQNFYRRGSTHVRSKMCGIMLVDCNTSLMFLVPSLQWLVLVPSSLCRGNRSFQLVGLYNGLVKPSLVFSTIITRLMAIRCQSKANSGLANTNSGLTVLSTV